MTCEHAQKRHIQDYSSCGDETILCCNKKKVHIIIDYDTTLEEGCKRLCLNCTEKVKE